ncbi:MAG: poly(hydroxyalkanoate) granule-associated protein [Anaerolineales bacterium]|nr:poly(hydroxyalkanoate) granule-associated protein [Anaerolineae bacterium]PWB51142.1 MAG: poly(hydroxyalkanoate) granule-associated protein [Anaerolineales bacterium]
MPTKPKAEAPVEPVEKGDSQMVDMVRKMMLAALGAAVIAEEEIETLINRLVERGELAEKDGKKLIHEAMDKRKNKTTNLTEDINKSINDVLQRMNIPTKADIDTLGQKIAGLSKKIDELKKSG